MIYKTICLISFSGAATKSQDLANTGDDLEDEDCINIRTDGGKGFNVNLLK